MSWRGPWTEGGSWSGLTGTSGSYHLGTGGGPSWALTPKAQNRHTRSVKVMVIIPSFLCMELLIARSDLLIIPH